MDKGTEEVNPNLQAAVDQMRNNCEYASLAELLQHLGTEQNDVSALRYAALFFVFAKLFCRAETIAEALCSHPSTTSTETSSLHAYSLILQGKQLQARSILEKLPQSAWITSWLGAMDEDFLLCLERSNSCRTRVVEASYLSDNAGGELEAVTECPHCQTQGKVHLQTALELTFVPCTNCFGPAVLVPRDLLACLGSLNARDARVQVLAGRVRGRFGVT